MRSGEGKGKGVSDFTKVLNVEGAGEHCLASGDDCIVVRGQEHVININGNKCHRGAMA